MLICRLCKMPTEHIDDDRDRICDECRRDAMTMRRLRYLSSQGHIVTVRVDAAEVVPHAAAALVSSTLCRSPLEKVS